MKAPLHKPRHASASYRLYVHLVWPTKYRKHVLEERLTPVVESKILEVCATKQYRLIVARAAVDHVHVLLGMRPTQAVSDIVRNLKSNSSAAAFATFSRLGEIIKMDVLWAGGYRAEFVNPGEVEKVKRYIVNQAEHHRTRFRFRARQDAKHVDYGGAVPKVQRPPSP
jgi:putative transposase